VSVADAPPRFKPKRLTITIKDTGEGWFHAQIEEIPEAISQGRTRDEAWRNVLSAVYDLVHEPTLGERLRYRLRARLADLRDLLPVR
jgi:predicted RNase H-like HicB family nuclease